MENGNNGFKNPFAGWKKKGGETEFDQNEVLDEILTPEEIRAQKESALRKRIFGVVFGIPLTLAVVFILFKSYYKYQDEVRLQTERQALEGSLTPTVVLPSADEEIWKSRQEQADEELHGKIDRLATDINKTVTGAIVRMEENSEKRDAANRKALADLSSEVRSIGAKAEEQVAKAVTKSERELKQLQADFKAEVERVADQGARLSRKVDSITIAENAVMLPPPPKTSGGESSSQPTPVAKNEDPVYIEESYELENPGSMTVSTLDEYIEVNAEVNDKNVSFRLGMGLAKGRIVTGTVAPTLEYGQANPEPVYISLTSSLMMPNDYFEDISDCSLIATAQGSLSNGRATMRLSELECNLEDINGERYVIRKSVSGWVFGEDGTHGVKGRLITKEGQIISKALPLGLLEGLMGALSNSSQLVVPNGGGNTNITGQDSVWVGALNGASDGSTRIIEKIADYYVKLLNSLNPTVEVRAGREVTILFKGGEMLSLEPYTPVDVAYFEGGE